MLKLAEDDDFEIREVGRSLTDSLCTVEMAMVISLSLPGLKCGNEASATRGLFTLFEFLRSDDEPGGELRETIREKLTLYFLPMRNSIPTGQYLSTAQYSRFRFKPLCR